MALQLPAFPSIYPTRLPSPLKRIRLRQFPHPPKFPTPRKLENSHRSGRNHSNSTSMLFAFGSRREIRKLRICPDRAGSGLAELAGPAETPPFHFACNIDESEERSTLFSVGALVAVPVSVGMRQVASIPSPNSARAWPFETWVM